MTSIHFVRGDALGAAYAHDVLVGDNNSRNLYAFEITHDRSDLVLPTPGTMDRVADSVSEREVFLFGRGFGAVTDIDTGPDGVYVCSITGAIYRIFPAPTRVRSDAWSRVKRIYR